MSIDDLRRVYEAEASEAMERLRFAADLARSGLQALMFVNGGALIALFTLIGNSGGLKFDVAALWWSFALFSIGLAGSLGSFLFAFLSQNQFYYVAFYLADNARAGLNDRPPPNDPKDDHKAGDRYLIAAIACAIGSLACFIAGAGFALFSVS